MAPEGVRPSERPGYGPEPPVRISIHFIALAHIGPSAFGIRGRFSAQAPSEQFFAPEP